MSMARYGITQTLADSAYPSPFTVYCIVCREKQPATGSLISPR
jgi:hypothetical protein